MAHDRQVKPKGLAVDFILAFGWSAVKLKISLHM